LVGDSANELQVNWVRRHARRFLSAAGRRPLEWLAGFHMPLQRSLGLLLALVFVASSVFAQPAPTPEEVQQAKVRWNEGKAFFDAGNFEAARVAFKQAYTIFPHPVFLQNLGEAELRSGRSVEAARHFEAFLRTSSSASASQRELAKKSLKKAAENLGSVVIDTNADNAEIRVDDEVVGHSPLGALEWYVAPGKHVVVARKEGYLDGSEQVFVPAGPAKVVIVRVQRVAGGTPDEAVVASGAGGRRRATAPAIRGTRVDEGSNLQPRTLVLVAGVALSVAALTLGTVYALKVRSDTSHIDDARAAITPITGCSGSSAPVEPCAELARYGTRLPTDRNVRNVAFVSAGVLGAATVAAFFLWPAPSPASTRHVTLLPSVESGEPGVVVIGRF
jgi:PEGA domain